VTVEATVRRELEIAREMQQSLLPAAAPEVPGVELAGYSVAANDVGGDYYDYFVLDESRLAVAVGDVTGHGVSSGLLMALAKGGLHNQVNADAAPAPVMTAMNRLICQSAGKRNLMSFVYAVVNAKNRTVELANAGHPSPYCFNSAERTVSAIEIGAYPLGVRAQSMYAPVEVRLEPGDAMVFYSDGIVEAQNPSGEVFGFERFEKAILRHGHLSATAMQDAILDEVRAFLGPQPMEDDVTLVVVKMQK
jgi:phosphoserine phosphatase RsbU/P